MEVQVDGAPVIGHEEQDVYKRQVYEENLLHDGNKTGYQLITEKADSWTPENSHFLL